MKGLIVLITGGGAGIGAATAMVLKKCGATPVLVDCDVLPLAQTAAALGGDVLTIVADVTSLAACEDAVLQTLVRFGRIDIVWANAGIAAFGPLEHTDPDAWKRCFEVNVFGVFNIVRASIPSVKQSRGYVAVSASLATFAHPPAVSAYAASKAAVEAMCNAWRIELASHGVGVGIIHASWVRTQLMTEGTLHPAFVRLRATTPMPLRQSVEPSVAAEYIVQGFCRRARQIWVPGWVRVLHWLRALLHTPLAERQLLLAAPEIEQLFLGVVAKSGVKASSQAPRELDRAEAHKAKD
jgi:NAD(P)-dependent dehydrogenase (short-subunit alcohol dehydrogenase family)